jgi:hypothetical protein
VSEITRCFGAPPVSITLRRGETKMAFASTNRGSLFRNENKDPNDEKDRDYSGSLNVDGAEFWLSGWIKTAKTGRKFLSLSIKPKQDRPATSEKPLADDLDDKIPF